MRNERVHTVETNMCCWQENCDHGTKEIVIRNGWNKNGEREYEERAANVDQVKYGQEYEKPRKGVSVG